MSAGTFTVANDQISGDAVSGGTIGTTTITALAGALSMGDNNITNVGDISLDSISSDAGTSINVVLGSDAGDDFTVDTTKLVVEGDTGNVGIGTASPEAPLMITGSNVGDKITPLLQVILQHC